MTQFSTLEDRALSMLGSGAPAGIVAQALGVTEGRISQLLANEEFSQAVADLRFKNLNKQTQLDDRYSDMETKLLDKLEKTLPFLTRPKDVASVLGTINGTKRRGAQLTQATQSTGQIVNLTIPIAIAHKFTTNVNNQVIEVKGEQGEAETLITATPAGLHTLSQQLLTKGDGSHDSNGASEELPKRIGSESLSEGFRQGTGYKGSDPNSITVEDLI